jgi:predicted acyltransferase (DUF342 family)
MNVNFIYVAFSFLFLTALLIAIYYPAYKLIKKADKEVDITVKTRPLQGETAQKIKKEILENSLLQASLKDLQPKKKVAKTLFSINDLSVPEKCHLQDIIAEKNCLIKEGCTVFGVLDAGHTLEILSNVKLKREASAKKTLIIDPSVSFTSLWGHPILVTGSQIPPAQSHNPFCATGAISEKKLFITSKQTVIPKNCVINADIIVKMDLLIAEGSMIEGNIKCYGTITILNNVTIRGNIISEKNISIATHCHIFGNIFSQKDIQIGSFTEIGVANEIKSVVAHGTLFLSPQVKIFGYAQSSDSTV